MKRTWSIFGCGPSGLYTAWRLVTSGRIKPGDTLALFEWGTYQLDKDIPGTRAAAGRICTYHYQGNPENAYVEIGGMRYIHWDGNESTGGHRLVTEVIRRLGLEDTAVPFNTTNDPLFYLRETNFYSSEVSSFSPAPYNANGHLADYPPAEGTVNTYEFVSDAVFGGAQYITRAEQCQFFRDGRLPDSFRSDVFRPGDRLENIGFWNLSYDILGSEGYLYAAAGGGYQANMINVHSANAVIINAEFTPGGTFKTLSGGYSSIYPALYAEIKAGCQSAGIELDYRPGTRLRSIWLDPANDNAITYTLANAEDPDRVSEHGVTDCAFLAMPPGSLEIVANGSRYAEREQVDVLNHPRVALLRESVVTEPAYKIAMFFDTEWWTDSMYPPRLTGDPSNREPETGEPIPNVFGPTITDTPLRQVYYFGDNAPNTSESVFALLASYDDEWFAQFWKELELGPDEARQVPLSRDLQPIEAPGKAPDVMVRMLRSQLAQVHFGPGAPASRVPEPLETVFMDWSLNPFAAGYHTWAPHYDINEAMCGIRKPTQLIDGVDADLFIVGSAYSNDQAWVEGAFCTAESVLVDFLAVDPLIDTRDYPLLCGCGPGDKD